MVITWVERAKQEQHFFHSQFKKFDYDEVFLRTDEGEKHSYLQKKLLFGMYGEIPKNNEDYYDTQVERARKIHDILIEQNKNLNGIDSKIEIAFVYMTGITENEDEFSIPVISMCYRNPKLKEASDSVLYVDIEGRVYKDWFDFIQTNEFPPCEYLYPKNGSYRGKNSKQLILKRGKSPAAGIKQTVLKYSDRTSLGLMAGGAITALVGLFVPVIAPIAIAGSVATFASAGYGAGRSICSLVDRSMHEQTINPIKDSSSAAHWFGLAGAATGFARFGSIAYLSRAVRTGATLGIEARVAANIVTGLSVTVNGMNVCYQSFDCYQKKKQGELGPGDIVNLALSALFFANEVCSIKTANTIISEYQDTEIVNYRGNLSDTERKQFYKSKKRIMYKTRHQGGTDIYGKAKVIRRMNIIDENILTKKLPRPQASLVEKNKSNVGEFYYLDDNKCDDYNEDSDEGDTDVIIEDD